MPTTISGLRLGVALAGLACVAACGGGSETLRASDESKSLPAGAPLQCEDGRPPTLLSYTLEAGITGGGSTPAAAAALLMDRSGRFAALDAEPVEVADGKTPKIKAVKFKDKNKKTKGNQAEFSAEEISPGDWFVTSYEACEEVEAGAVANEVSAP